MGSFAIAATCAHTRTMPAIWIVLCVLFALWLLGYLAPQSPVYRNNLAHVFLAAVLVVLVLEYAFGFDLGLRRGLHPLPRHR